MKLCRFQSKSGQIHLGLVVEGELRDLTPAGITQLTTVLENDDPVAFLQHAARAELPKLNWADVQLCAPVERQEVWAAGVTYLRSKTARMEESEF
ncbi:MAG TPA: hypothetical protein VK737_00970, partial [Opitutales bacterium]|nr:hypothetical protein [Opitutales bacterium]